MTALFQWRKYGLAAAVAFGAVPLGVKALSYPSQSQPGSVDHSVINRWSSSTEDVLNQNDRYSGQKYGRISPDEFVLTPEQIEAFHRDGCVTIEDVLSEEEVEELGAVFDRFVSGEIQVSGKGERF
jgi:hypothetical protein